VNPIELQLALVPIRNPNFIKRQIPATQQAPVEPFIYPPTYSKPNNRVSSVILESAYTGQIIQPPSPCGDNCTFTQSFVGPAYQCVDKDPYDKESPWCQPGIDNATSAVLCSQLSGYLPDLSYVTFYQASNSSGDFCTNLTSNSAACGLIDNTTEAWNDGIPNLI
jgi:hypothetical protein